MLSRAAKPTVTMKPHTAPAWRQPLILASASAIALAMMIAGRGQADTSQSATAAGFAAARASFAAASAELSAHFSDIQRRSGAAADLEERIDSEAGVISVDPTAPPAWTSMEYADTYRRIAELDASLIHQLATGTYHDPASVRGVGELLVKTPADGTMQPYALFVPTAYDPAKRASLVIFLHGRGLNEADTLGVPFIRDLAQATGTIVAAPYARGDIQYASPAPADIDATVDAVEKAFNVDRSRVYLAGYSMGGYGVFEVGPSHPEIWSALLCISGSLTLDDQDAVIRAFRKKTVYLVSGVKDDVVPNRESLISAQFLRAGNVATRLYAAPDGGHSMATFGEALHAAWFDMLNGIRGDSGLASSDSLVSLPPAPSSGLPDGH